MKPSRLLKGMKGEGGRAEKQSESVSRGELCIENGRTQLSLHPAPTPRPLIQTAAAEPDHCSIPLVSFICSHSFNHSPIHPFSTPLHPADLLGRSKPNQLSSVGPGRPSVLVRVSAGLSNGPALISQLLQIKREVSGYYSKPLR